MRRYSEAVKADVRRRMGPPHRQSVAQISQEPGIHVITLYKWRKAWRLQGEVVPASQKDPEGWGPADKFTVVLEIAGLNATELGGYCRERGLFPEQVARWRQAAQDANAQPLLTMADQKDLPGSIRSCPSALVGPIPGRREARSSMSLSQDSAIHASGPSPIDALLMGPGRTSRSGIRRISPDCRVTPGNFPPRCSQNRT
jgi:transposase